MSAPDFYFAVSSIFRHIHDHHGKQTLVKYWRDLGREHYAQRWRKWRDQGLPAIAQDWQDYFSHEPGAELDITTQADRVVLDIHTCPAIKHIRAHNRHLPEYFCEHCDHICGSMAEEAGFQFIREGGMGSCRQSFVQLTTSAPSPAQQ